MSIKHITLVQDFIQAHPESWEEKLKSPPYRISVSRDTLLLGGLERKLVMFSYDKSSSHDFSNSLVQECRGLILADDGSFDVISYPFNKFGNYGDSYADEISWDDPKLYVTEKIDGSIIKIVNLGGDLLISSNRVIDAGKADICPEMFSGCPFTSFKGAVLMALASTAHPEFIEGYTYIFELTSKWIGHVIKYPEEAKITLIGLRANDTLKEEDIYSSELCQAWPKPKMYSIAGGVPNLISEVRAWDASREGVVVVDKDFKRVKIKSASYLYLHRLRDSCLNVKPAWEIIRENDLEEVLGVFDKDDGLKHTLLEFNRQVDNLINRVTLELQVFSMERDALPKEALRKDVADLVLKVCSDGLTKSLAFKLEDGKFSLDDLGGYIKRTFEAKDILKWLV